VWRIHTYIIGHAGVAYTHIRYACVPYTYTRHTYATRETESERDREKRARETERERERETVSEREREREREREGYHAAQVSRHLLRPLPYDFNRGRYEGVVVSHKFLELHSQAQTAGQHRKAIVAEVQLPQADKHTECLGEPDENIVLEIHRCQRREAAHGQGQGGQAVVRQMQFAEPARVPPSLIDVLKARPRIIVQKLGDVKAREVQLLVFARRVQPCQKVDEPLVV
jgi:hypothetical protein